jgi:hypothetical protein
MNQSFAVSDRTTLRCSQVPGLTEVDVASLELGPLVELWIFRRRSLPEGANLKLRGAGVALSEALKGMPSGSVWAYRKAKGCSVLRVKAGAPSDEDDLVQQQFLLDIRKELERHGAGTSAAQALTGAAGELIDNVGEHAGSDCEALAAFQISSGSMWLSVGDSGKGVLATYNTTPEISSAQDALSAAVLQHRSSTGDPARGL